MSAPSTVATDAGVDVGAEPRARYAWWAAAVVVGIVMAAVYVPHVRAYFFLFDDYALVGQASSLPIGDIVSQPLFGFYRPAAFLLARAEFDLFGGWHAPSAFAASALTLHAASALLAGLLASRLRVSRVFSVATGLLFLLSPWAGEAFFWSSARFDLLATLGTLLALWLADLAADLAADEDARSRRLPIRVACALGAGLASALALLSKEAAVTLPLLFIVFAMMKPKPAGARRDRAGMRWRVALAALFVTIVGLYLWRRHSVLPGLAGQYGSFSTLIAQGDLLRHAAEYALAMVLVPMPPDWSAGSLALTVLGKWPFLIVTVPGLVLLALRAAWRHVLCCAIGFALALAPVAWVGLTPMNTASGRLLHLPGLFFALLLARGIHEAFAAADSFSSSSSLSSSSSSSPAAAGSSAAAPRTRATLAAAWLAAVLVPTVYLTGSLRHQQQMWSTASTLAREAVRQFQPLVGSHRPVLLTNLPFWFVEGPFVLKSYAFQYYYAPRAVPPVRATAVVLAFDPTDAHAVREVARIEEPGSLPTPPPPGEVPFAFTLPVTGQTRVGDGR